MASYRSNIMHFCIYLAKMVLRICSYFSAKFMRIEEGKLARL